VCACVQYVCMYIVYVGRTIAVVFFTQGLPDRQNGRAWARWIANCLSYSISLFVCVLAGRKVFFINMFGERNDCKSRVRLISNDMYVISVICKIKFHNFGGVLLDI